MPTNHKNNRGYCYRRIKSRGRFRDWLEHRMVLYTAIEQNPFLVALGYLERFREMEVHHVDGRQLHNCHGNLMLLDRSIHYGISMERKRQKGAKGAKGAEGYGGRDKDKDEYTDSSEEPWATDDDEVPF